MPLQIRRGTDAERTAMTQPLAAGELIFVTNTNRLYIGNGTTNGGVPVTDYTDEQARDAVAPMLVNGTHSAISFVYDDALDKVNATVNLSDYQGVIKAAAFNGSVVANDSSLLIDGNTGKFNLSGRVGTDIIPDTDVTYDLGSATYRFRDLYLSGSSIKLGAATITATGTAVNLPAGSTIGGLAIGMTGGDLNVNIVADDSTVIVNTTTEVVTAQGGFVGNVTGNITGNAGSVTNGVYITDTGTVTNTMLAGSIVDTKLSTISTAGKVSNSATTATNANISSAIVSRDGSGNFLANFITATGLIGNVVGDLNGDVKGSVFAEDSTLMVDATSGDINAGVLTVTTKINVDYIEANGATGLNVRTNGITPLSVEGIGTLSPGTSNVFFNIRAAKGSITSPTTTAGGDYLGGVNIQGYTGSTYKNAASIQALWVPGATLSDTYPASAIAISVGGNGSVLHSAVLGPQGVFTAPIFQMTNYATTAYPSGGPISLLSGVTITGVAGQFQCTSTTLKVGGTVTIRGTLAGATISGYASPTTYYIVTTNGTTTFTLSTTNGGSGVTTSGTTPTGVSYELSLPQAGMIIFDTTTNDFMGYNGTAWVAFTGP